MPDSKGNKVAEEETSTPLHAYKEGREGDVEGDPTGADAVSGDSDDGGDPGKH